MRALVTGGAGFIGSHLAEALLAAGHDVRVVDCLTPYYGAARKRDNLARLAGAEITAADLTADDLDPVLDSVDVVFHQAGQPGVRLSWAEHFPVYSANNILATQRLLEACRGRSLQRFVFASSSSVYGDAERYPTTVDDLPCPRSPYGVTKLAAEHLCGLYASTWGVPTVSLRYFTVYGPRQRPDMSFQRLCEAALTGDPFPLYGDGSQVREFTYVGDVVEANLAALDASAAPGSVFNVSGGASATMTEAIDIVGELAGRPVSLDRQPTQSGDVRRTGGDIDATRAALGWAPATDLRTGLARQLEWQASHRYESAQGTSVTG